MDASPTGLTITEDIYDPRLVRGLFDRMSRSYERMNVIFSFGFSVYWRRQLMRLIPAEAPAERVIDLMSGMGETWAELTKRFSTSELWALDFSPQMMEHATTRNRDRFDGKFTLVCEDMLQNTLLDATFDVIVSAYGLKTFDTEQSQKLASEVARILKPGGRFSFIEVAEPPNAVLRWLYTFYLARVLPTLGVLLVSDPVEYRMLNRYLRGYGSGERSAAAFRDHPQLEVQERLHFFGCARSFSGSRVSPARSDEDTRAE